jgi:hypothetical protein
MNSKAAARTLLTKAPLVKILEILKILIQNPGYRIKSDYPKG